MSVDQLRPMVRQLAHTAEIHAYNWMVEEEPTISELLDGLPEAMAVYTQSAALLAADWYNSQDEESAYFAFPMEEIAPERLENTARWIFDGPQRPENRLRTAAFTMVFDAARNTVYYNAQTEGVSVVRHEQFNACNDCVARATTSPRARNSGSDDIATDFHHSCSGMFVPVRRGIYDPPSHAKEWQQRIKVARQAGNTTPEEIALWLNAH